MNKCNKELLMTFLFFISFFIFCTTVTASPETCSYQGGDNFGMAKLTISDAKKSKANASFTKLTGPKNSLIGKKLDKTKSKDYSKSASKSISTVLHYNIDDSGKTKSESIPNINMGEECPKYLMVVIGEVIDANLKLQETQVFAGGEELKSFLQSKLAGASETQTLITGTKYTLTSKEVDKDEQKSDEKKETTEEQLDTCEGLLGTKVNGEYANGTPGALFQQIFDYMKLAAVVLLFAFSVIDYAKALTEQDSDLFKKANIHFLKRVIFGLIFFLIPTIVNIILGVIDSSTCGIN